MVHECMYNVEQMHTCFDHAVSSISHIPGHRDHIYRTHSTVTYMHIIQIRWGSADQLPNGQLVSFFLEIISAVYPHSQAHLFCRVS